MTDKATDTSWCGVGFRFVPGTDIIDDVSPQSFLYPHVKPGDRITQFRDSAYGERWVSPLWGGMLVRGEDGRMRMNPDIPGPWGTNVELHIKRYDGSEETVRVQRKAFDNDVGVDGTIKGIKEVPDAKQHCPMILSDISATIKGRAAQADLSELGELDRPITVGDHINKTRILLV